MNRTVTYAALGAFLLVVGGLAAVAVLRSREADSPDDGATFEGDLVLGFERSSFTPCGHSDTHYWLVWSKDVDLMEKLRELGFKGPYAEAHLAFDGALETGAPSGYGHLGQYVGQIEVTGLRKISRGSCQ